MNEREFFLAVRCPSCEAVRGKRCVTRNGNVLRPAFHAARKDLAYKLQAPIAHKQMETIRGDES